MGDYFDEIADRADALHEARSGMSEGGFRVIQHNKGWVVEKRVGGSLPAIWNMAETRVWSTNELAQQRAVALSQGAVPEFSESDILKPNEMPEEFPANTRFSPFPEPVMRPAEPEVGTVLGFTKQYSEEGPVYSFAAIHATSDQRGWYLSGPRNAAQPLDWDSLLDFVGGPDDWARVGVCMAWTPLVLP